jgi:transcriptional regulator with XRE-family HTH domain
MGLRAIRERRGLTQTQLAKLSGVEQNTISELETTAVPNPRWATVRRLARALNVKPHDLFSLRERRATKAAIG